MSASAEPEDLSAKILGPLVPGRTCGGCTACCRVLDIDEPDLKKPRDVLCVHCTGSGCGRYPDWPKICGQWFCAWRRIPSMPDQLRPDQLGVVFYLRLVPEETNPFARRSMMGLLVNGPEDLENPNVQAAIRVFSQQIGLPVAINYQGMTTLLHPRAEVARAVSNPDAPEHAEVRSEAMAWRQAMRLDA